MPFLAIEAPPATFGQCAQLQGADCKPLQIEHGVAKGLGGAPDLTVASLPHPQFDFGCLGAPLKQL